MEKKMPPAQNPISNIMSKQILEQLPTPVMAVDKDLRIIYMNNAGCRMTGKKREALEGNYCYSIMKSKHCNTPECRMRQVIEGGKSVTVRNEVTLSGRVLPIEYTSDALVDDNGEIVGGLEYIIDITETVRRYFHAAGRTRVLPKLAP